MEQSLICLCLILGCGELALEILAAGVLWRLTRKREQGPVQPKPEELPEEQEARRVAAEAQRLYEQGFVNLMRYDGSPGRKECEDL